MRDNKQDRPSGRQRRYDLQERLLEYAATIIRTVERLPRTPAGAHIAGQLLRSGTSPLPNHGEAQAAESPADFIHKLSICLRELRETHRWLLLIQRVPLVSPPAALDSVLNETEELISIFVTSLRTASENRGREVREEAAVYDCRSMFDVGCSMLDVQDELP